MDTPHQPIAVGRPSRVLIAEEDQVSLGHIRELLGKSGYDIVVAQDGITALQILESKNPPALAVMDSQMQGLNGIDICRRLRENGGRHIYTILLTRWNQQNDRVAGLEAGADDCLFRPVDVRELRVRLQIGAQLLLERELRETQERLRGAFEFSVIGMALVNASGEFLQVNPAFCNLFGEPKEQLFNENFHDFFHPGDLPSSKSLLKQVLEGAQPYEAERRMRRKDGTELWIYFTAAPVRDANKNLSCLVVQLKDMTRGKKMGEALQRSEAFARAITDNVEDLVMVINIKQEILYASPSFLLGLGYTSEELLGTDARLMVHPDDVQRITGTVAARFQGIPLRAVGLRMRHKNGTWRHIESKAGYMQDANGQVESLVVVLRIADERIAAEQKLQAAYADTELLLHSIPSILIGLDHSGRITRWNPTANTAFGITDEEVIGQTLQTCGIQWVNSDMDREISNWLATETIYNCPTLTYQFEDSVHFVDLRVRRIPTPGTDAASFIITGQEVTEKRTLEEHLRQAQKLEAIGQLAAGIAHEINTPTQFVGDNVRFFKDSWAQIANVLQQGRNIRQEADKGQISPETLAGFDQICEQADVDYLVTEIPHAIDQSLEGIQRVAKIVRAMKEFSHPGSEEKLAVDLNKAIETTITVAKNEWKYLADVITQFDESLPLVPCLAGEINQVILNLIVNAAHAIGSMVEDGAKGKGKITITTRAEGNSVVISVSDTGTGIPKELQPRVFEPFFTTKAVGKGTGQGLTLAHAVVVTRHQGKIWFESEEGRGTTFYIRLPLEVGPSVQ